ncbi:MAG: MotA/TolQ/ExbB proton channel family protein [Phycisphaerae bacterium]|nr:MotA/TolQ/ExbB proton channel family protein [Phycisphaerae bacterium]
MRRSLMPPMPVALASLAAFVACTAPAWAVGVPPNAAGAASPAAATPGTLSGSLRGLFLESFDLFTILLLMGSVYAGAIIVKCILEIRPRFIFPVDGVEKLERLAHAKRWTDLRLAAEEDPSMVARIVRVAIRHRSDDRGSIREAAEVAASEQVAFWFRKIEPLNVVGNLGPLLGLAGTVWGMIIAFASLGASGGQPNPGALSLGISKALFHTLLGLMLAVPSLLFFGFYRGIVDRLCTRAMSAASELVDMLPESARTRQGDDGEPAPRPVKRAAPPAPAPAPQT